MRLNRRAFTASLPALVFAPALAARAEEKPGDLAHLKRQVGVTTSSLSGHLAAKPKPGQFSLLELPRILRDELDMRVIDLNTSSLASQEPDYLDRCRAAAEKAGCVFTNLKMNQRNLNMDSADGAQRAEALREYKRSIDAAARLGCRWARPLPRAQRPDMRIHVAGYQELADYAAKRHVQMLVENFGWMQADADSVPQLIKAIGRNVAACPDTGNWDSQALRRAGLAKAFPLAVTCDFKARALGPKGEHELYDLHECFQIGWSAGFQGPWFLEHAHRDRKQLFRELALLRDMLRDWMKNA